MKHREIHKELVTKVSFSSLLQRLFDAQFKLEAAGIILGHHDHEEGSAIIRELFKNGMMTTNAYYSGNWWKAARNEWSAYWRETENVKLPTYIPVPCSALHQALIPLYTNLEMFWTADPCTEVGESPNFQIWAIPIKSHNLIYMSEFPLLLE